MRRAWDEWTATPGVGLALLLLAVAVVLATSAGLVLFLPAMAFAFRSMQLTGAEAKARQASNLSSGLFYRPFALSFAATAIAGWTVSLAALFTLRWAVRRRQAGPRPRRYGRTPVTWRAGNVFAAM